MDDLLLKFYNTVIQYENDSIQLGNELDAEVIKLLSQYQDKFSDEERELIKGLMYQLMYEAQRTGYVLGVKSIIQVYIELLDM